MVQYIEEMLINVASVKLNTWAHQMTFNRKLERQTTHRGNIFANHNLIQSLQTDVKPTLKPQEDMQHDLKTGNRIDTVELNSCFTKHTKMMLST